MRKAVPGLSQSSNGILICNEKNEVIYASQSCQDLFNCPAQSIQHKEINCLFDNISNECIFKDVSQGRKKRARIKLGVDGRSMKGTLSGVEVSSGVHWITLEIVFPREPAENHIPSRARGEDRTRIERPLENFLDDLLDASFDGIVISDAKGNVLKANRAYEELSGIRKQEVVGHNLRDLIKGGLIKKAAVFEVTKTRMQTTMSHYYSRTGKTGMVTGNPVFDSAGELVYVVANLRDITQLTKMSKKLGYSEILETGSETLYLNPKLANQPDYGILVHNKRMDDCLQQALRVAQFDTHVLILGETGTGKTRIAEIIHRASPRAKKPFVSINCGSIPESLLESELFGYEKGAFTGASSHGKIGQFELAAGGTLVLDEVAELSPALQAKLLKAIEEKRIQKIGRVKPLEVDIRIIAVTNKDLVSMTQQGSFRKDLFYRLSVVPIVVPPLRERKNEIPLLVKYFFNQFNRSFGIQKYPSEGLLRALAGYYDYPGNVRELKNLVERLIVMSPTQTITEGQLKAFAWEPQFEMVGLLSKETSTLKGFLESCEKRAILKVLKEEKNLAAAGRHLGLSNPTLWRRLKKFGLSKRNEFQSTSLAAVLKVPPRIEV